MEYFAPRQFRRILEHSWQSRKHFLVSSKWLNENEMQFKCMRKSGDCNLYQCWNIFSHSFKSCLKWCDWRAVRKEESSKHTGHYSFNYECAFFSIVNLWLHSFMASSNSLFSKCELIKMKQSPFKICNKFIILPLFPERIACELNRVHDKR